MPGAGVPEPALQRAVLLRRNLAVDRCGRDYGLHVASAGLHDDAPVREPAQEGELQGVRHRFAEVRAKRRTGTDAAACRKTTLSRCRGRFSRIFRTRRFASSWRTAT